jgi:hypothetical protein
MTQWTPGATLCQPALDSFTDPLDEFPPPFTLLLLGGKETCEGLIADAHRCRLASGPRASFLADTPRLTHEGKRGGKPWS